MENKEKLPNALIKAAGEFYVAAELSRRGYLASVTMGNTDRFDILASDLEGKRPITIQVKTTTKRGEGWILGHKDENPRGGSSFYVFVKMAKGSERPQFHIVPSDILAHTISQSHKKWLNTPGKKGQKHKDTTVRQFFDREGTYLEKWDLLKQNTVVTKSVVP